MNILERAMLIFSFLSLFIIVRAIDSDRININKLEKENKRIEYKMDSLNTANKLNFIKYQEIQLNKK